MVKNTQERIIDEIYLYLLGSDDNKVRFETARSLVRFVSNMNAFNLSNTNSQNVLLSTSEHLLKSGGYAANMFNSSLLENDWCNLSSASFLFNNNNNGNNNIGNNNSTNRSTASILTPSILHSQKQVKLINNSKFNIVKITNLFE